MSDRVHSLTSRVASAPHRPTVRLLAVPPLTRASVRAGPDAVVTIGDTLGVVLPITPCRTSGSGDRCALWLGPDEWLVIADQGTDLPATLPTASIVDVSQAFTGIAVSGPRATWTINAFCALDLHIAAFPVGMCTRTLFGKAQIILWRLDVEVFRIEVARSIAPYVWDLLEEARREFLDQPHSW
jgi:sarcosine oxidase subunit gamma